MLDMIFAWMLLLFAPLIFAYAGCSDLFNMRISNRIALIFLVAFPLFAVGIGMPLMDILRNFGVGAITLAICFFFWSRGWIGGGDAKFAAVAAIWLGPELAITFFVLTSIYGGALSLAILTVRSRFLPAFLLKMDWVMRLYSVKKIPYGVALCAAGLQIYAMSDWMDAGIRLAVS